MNKLANKCFSKTLCILAILLQNACSEPARKPSLTEAQATTTSIPTSFTLSKDRLPNAAADGDNWLTYGRTYSEQRYSPLTQINTDNANELGLAWYYDIPVQRGMEATSLVVDGRMYTTSGWSKVYAMDAATGRELWTYDPQVPHEKGAHACCDVINRGVAAWGDKIYVGTIDGRLIALNASSGKPVWDVQTTDTSQPYTISGAPRAVKGKILIGNSGAEYGVRGYISAYDAETGEQIWRFYTVPGNPANGFESDTMKAAADTWTGEWWKYGGGGTVWNAMAYDPDLDLLYFGVGNGSPWDRNVRSPQGGDNLFLSSIVAVRPDSGEYVWHYQTTPGDSWDYTATQDIILMDLEIDGKTRKVLTQAPKNGFFYVIDRATGELISANNYVPVSWATHVDLQTGRPVETANARYENENELQFPSPFGGHNWHPMAYSPDTGLVYIPAQEASFVYNRDPNFKYSPGFWNLSVSFEPSALPEDPEELKKILPLIKGRLLAWDPVKQEEAFHIEHPGPWNGGILATAGNLIFQGTPGGEFRAYRADNGEQLWKYLAQTGVVAGPITYRVNGEQYVSVAVGWGTIFGLSIHTGQQPRSRILTFKLGGKKSLPPVKVAAVDFPEPPPMAGDPEQVARGKTLFFTRCFMCHGDGAVSGGVLPDLRRIAPEKHAIWKSIVVDGAFAKLGMPKFQGTLSEADAEDIRQYVIKRAHETRPESIRQQ